MRNGCSLSRWFRLAAAPARLSLIGALASVIGCGDDETTASAGSGGTGPLIGEDTIPETVLDDAQLGDPRLESAQRLGFTPGGVLLVADGVGDRVVAIETGDGGFGEVPAPDDLPALRSAVAELYDENASASEIVVNDVAVEPTSRRVYLAAERYHAGEVEPVIAHFDAEGRLRRFATEQVVWAELHLPPNESAGSFVSVLLWHDERVLVSASDGGFAPPTVFVIDELRHGTFASSVQPSTYLPATGMVHADLPLLAATGYEALGQPWLVAAFVGAPVARFLVDELDPGLALGQTVFDLGQGREVRDLVALDDGDRKWLWMSVFNGAFDGSILGYRVGGSLVEGAHGVDALAPTVVDFTGIPLHPEVLMEPALHGALRIAVRTTASLVVLRDDSLEVERFD